MRRRTDAPAPGGNYARVVNAMWDRLRARDSRHPELLDSLLALLLLLGGALAAASGPQTRPPDATGYLLLTLGALPYPLRRRAPVPVLVLASIPVLALLALGYQSAVIGAGLFLTAYTVADWCSARWTVFAAVGARNLIGSTGFNALSMLPMIE